MTCLNGAVLFVDERERLFLAAVRMRSARVFSSWSAAERKPKNDVAEEYMVVFCESAGKYLLFVSKKGFQFCVEKLI